MNRPRPLDRLRYIRAHIRLERRVRQALESLRGAYVLRDRLGALGRDDAELEQHIRTLEDTLIDIKTGAQP